MRSSEPDNEDRGPRPTHLSADSGQTRRTRSRASSVARSLIGRARSISSQRGDGPSLLAGLRRAVSSDPVDLKQPDIDSIPPPAVLVLCRSQGEYPEVSMGACPIEQGSEGKSPLNLVLIKHNILPRDVGDNSCYEHVHPELKSLVDGLRKGRTRSMNETGRQRFQDLLDSTTRRSSPPETRRSYSRYDWESLSAQQQDLVDGQPSDPTVRLNILSPTEISESVNQFQNQDSTFKYRTRPDWVSDLCIGVGESIQTGAATTAAGGKCEQGPFTDRSLSDPRLTPDLGPLRRDQEHDSWTTGLSDLKGGLFDQNESAEDMKISDLEGDKVWRVLMEKDGGPGFYASTSEPV